MNTRIKLIMLLLCIVLPSACLANSVSLNGVGNIFSIKRSLAENWSSSTGMTLATENTLPAQHKIVVSGTVISPDSWKSRYFRIRVDIPISWLAISPTVFSIQREIISDGVANGAADLIRNIGIGNYLPAPLFYEGRADRGALPGDATVTITLTIISQE